MTLASGSAIHPMGDRLVVGPTAMYWPDDTGAVLSVGLNGGAVSTVAGGLTKPFSVVQAGSNLYFTEFNGTSSRILQALATGVNQTPVVLAAAQLNSIDLAADSVNLFWCNGGTTPGVTTDGSLMALPLSGGTPVTLASNLIEPDGIALDGGNVYFVSWANPGNIAKVSKTGGTVTSLATGAFPIGIAVDGTTVYWANNGGVDNAGEIWKMSTDGSAQVRLAAGQDQPSGAVALDANNVYWTNTGTNGAVMKVGKSGGAPVVLASGVSHPEFAAVDDTCFYFATSDPAVMKVTK